jgi:hypothetical protein
MYKNCNKPAQSYHCDDLSLLPGNQSCRTTTQTKQNKKIKIVLAME